MTHSMPAVPPQGGPARPSPLLVRSDRVTRSTLQLLAVALLAAVTHAAPDPAGSDAGRSLVASPPGDDPRGERLLLFVMERGAMPLDRGASEGRPGDRLGRLTDGDVAGLAPGGGRAARRVIGADELALLCGDVDRDGLHGDRPGGSIDALGVRRDRAPHHADLLPQLVFSTEHDLGLPVDDWGEDLDGAFDGSLFRLDRDPAGRAEVRVFLSERDVLRALGQPPQPQGDVDIDAFTQTEAGDVFLSFRHDELVHGVTLADDGVVCLPAESFVFDARGDVQWVQFGSARIVLDRDGVSALVKHAALRRPSGTTVGSVIDLQGLALDPAGGHFEPTEPVPGLDQGVPHLLFAGQALGPTVLTTADGGRLATLDGQPLGAGRMSGLPLGLAPIGDLETRHDLGALHVLPARPARPKVTSAVTRLDVITGHETMTLALDGFAPHEEVWLGLGSTILDRGERLARRKLGGSALGPWLALPEGSLAWPVTVDARGRARIELAASHKPDHAFLLVAQALRTHPPGLSAPTGVWIH